MNTMIIGIIGIFVLNQLRLICLDITENTKKSLIFKFYEKNNGKIKDIIDNFKKLAFLVRDNWVTIRNKISKKHKKDYI